LADLLLPLRHNHNKINTSQLVTITLITILSSASSVSVMRYVMVKSL